MQTVTEAEVNVYVRILKLYWLVILFNRYELSFFADKNLDSGKESFVAGSTII